MPLRILCFLSNLFLDLIDCRIVRRHSLFSQWIDILFVPSALILCPHLLKYNYPSLSSGYHLVQLHMTSVTLKLLRNLDRTCMYSEFRHLVHMYLVLFNYNSHSCNSKLQLFKNNNCLRVEKTYKKLSARTFSPFP